jgi:acetolactate decarboxylase
MTITKIRIAAFTILLLFIFSCYDSSRKDQSFEVEYKGALKNFMKKGDLSAKVDLSEFKEKGKFYALGAMENLKGEIQIFDGKPHNSMLEEGVLKIDNGYSQRAALLVYTTVQEWVSIPIPAEIVSEKAIEKHIEEAAREHNINTDQPFPFLINGNVKSINWHVIDWKEGDTEHTHEKHISSGINGTIENQQVELLGFYSDSHHRIFTHHTTNMHIHMKLHNGEIAGHVDELELGENMTLKLPKNE